MTASDLVTDADVEKPDEWPMRTAASFKPFITSGSRGWAKYYADHGDLFMRITNLKRHKIKPDLSDRQHVTLPTTEKEGLRTGLRQGDILISITADIGIIGYVDESIPTPAYINQHVACLRLPADQVSPKFVAYYLASAEPQRRFIEMTDVGAKTGINLTTVGRLTFPCPPLREQEAIAEALSDADALIEGMQRLIAKKRLVKQGAMQDLLTAKRRLPGFSGEWVERKLGTLLTVRHGRSQKEVEVPSGQYPILATGGQIGTANSYLWDKPSVLIGRKGTIDRPQFVETPFWTVDTLFYTDILPSNDPRFIFYVFQRIDWQSYNEASGVPSLNAKTIENIDVFVPGSDEQIAISAALKDMDAEIQTLETRLEKARQVKEGMMQNLFTGRVRLV